MESLPFDMAATSFDDQYNGCVDKMDDKVGKLQRTEFATSNSNYEEVWKAATTKWNRKKPKGLKQQYAIAVFAYTKSSDSLYSQLNEAVRKAGQSEDYYLRNFHFKSFHYLLTRALQVLVTSSNHKCYITYRGVKGITFTTELYRKVRFGHFASSSLNKKTAEGYGDDTFFTIKTCYGAYIKDFSFFPNEEEVLIPPYELFLVEDFKETGGKTHISLTSEGKHSNYNCVYVKGNCGETPF
ncbi:erythroblast NAD(P)(+)--arginine ADP-ribosyltransferase-like [Heteronotia binoei]|uniref:erythroblast NAD(P)(+)--arginine ADP-ribosyltransferase-like n=1 Tax=Heteronotia binoei TaxID=13085 RepID=UPI002930A549|nr:erythroblast NAD(P)(+)--arginine ADP-ribosyltransferase-like [Heteronotia binoei]